MWRLIVLTVAGSIACSGASSPSAPTSPAPTPEPPMPAATLRTAGNLSITNCVFAGDAFTCDYSGPAENIGPGCAQNVRGTTKTYPPKPFDTMISSTSWTFSGLVHPNERFTYHGVGAIVPRHDGWTYLTDFTWDNVRCP